LATKLIAHVRLPLKSMEKSRQFYLKNPLKNRPYANDG